MVLNVFRGGAASGARCMLGSECADTVFADHHPHWSSPQ